jgi:O-antigen ligase
MLLRLLLAIPIVLMPNLLYLPLDTGIPSINLANLLLIVVVMGLLMSPRDRLTSHTTGVLTPAMLLLFLAVVIGYVIAVTTLPTDPLPDLTSVKNFVFYPLLYFVYRRCKQDLRGTRQLIYLSLAVVLAASMDTILQGLASDAFASYSDTNRFAGPFGDYRSANRAGVYFAMFLPMFAAFALFLRGHKVWVAIAIAGCAIVSMAIMLTYSRQSYLIAILAVALLLVRRHLVLAVVLALATVPAISLLPTGVTERVAGTQQYTRSGHTELDVSTVSRFEIWGGAMKMWQDHPEGVGLDRFPHYIGEYTSYPNFDAHNMYVLILSECGPLGLLALLWLLWRMLRLALALRRSGDASDTELQALGMGFTVSVIAMAMGNLYGSPFHEGLVMANFWIMCGLVERYSLLKRHAAMAAAKVDDTRPVAIPQAIAGRYPLSERILPGRYREIPK